MERITILIAIYAWNFGIAFNDFLKPKEQKGEGEKKGNRRLEKGNVHGNGVDVSLFALKNYFHEGKDDI